MEGVITVLGLCIIFVPLIQFCNYLLNHVMKKMPFDEHLERLKDNSKVMRLLAYCERVLYGITISSLGYWMSEYFQNSTVFVILVISLVLYIIVKYFDYKNEV